MVHTIDGGMALTIAGHWPLLILLLYIQNVFLIMFDVSPILVLDAIKDCVMLCYVNHLPASDLSFLSMLTERIVYTRG